MTAHALDQILDQTHRRHRTCNRHYAVSAATTVTSISNQHRRDRDCCQQTRRRRRSKRCLHTCTDRSDNRTPRHIFGHQSRGPARKRPGRHVQQHNRIRFCSNGCDNICRPGIRHRRPRTSPNPRITRRTRSGDKIGPGTLRPPRRRIGTTGPPAHVPAVRRPRREENRRIHAQYRPDPPGHVTQQSPDDTTIR